MKNTLIGITGRAGAGKDTVADYLVAHHGFQRLAIADAIKDGVAAMFGIDRSSLDDRELKEQVIPWLGKSPRQLAQLLGTEFGRELVADDVWLRVAERSMKPGVRYVLSDVRFENESAMVRRLGGVVLHIDRQGSASGTSSSHASENGVQMFVGDRYVRNVGSVEDFLLSSLRVLSV